MARRAVIRASDADRDRVADRLRAATAEGRLLAEELEERLEALFAARTPSGHRVVRTDARIVEVELHGGARRIAYDGEAAAPVSRLWVEILPGALRVVVPEA